jgi:hypothetical protein
LVAVLGPPRLMVPVTSRGWVGSTTVPSVGVVIVTVSVCDAPATRTSGTASLTRVVGEMEAVDAADLVFAAGALRAALGAGPLEVADVSAAAVEAVPVIWRAAAGAFRTVFVTVDTASPASAVAASSAPATACCSAMPPATAMPPTAARRANRPMSIPLLLHSPAIAEPFQCILTRATRCVPHAERR